MELTLKISAHKRIKVQKEHIASLDQRKVIVAQISREKRIVLLVENIKEGNFGLYSVFAKNVLNGRIKGSPEDFIKELSFQLSRRKV